MCLHDKFQCINASQHYGDTIGGPPLGLSWAGFGYANSLSQFSYFFVALKVTASRNTFLPFLCWGCAWAETVQQPLSSLCCFFNPIEKVLDTITVKHFVEITYARKIDLIASTQLINFEVDNFWIELTNFELSKFEEIPVELLFTSKEFIYGYIHANKRTAENLCKTCRTKIARSFTNLKPPKPPSYHICHKDGEDAPSLWLTYAGLLHVGHSCPTCKTAHIMGNPLRILVRSTKIITYLPFFNSFEQNSVWFKRKILFLSIRMESEIYFTECMQI